jgi:hypothetical protein
VTWEDAHAWLRDCRDWIQRHWGAETDGRIAGVEREIAQHHSAAARWTAMVSERWMELVAERSLWRQDLLPLRATG